MAVHSHVFRPYEGPREKAGTRWMVLARYALGDALSQKKTVALLVLSAFPTLAAAVMIYLRHNLEALKKFKLYRALSGDRKVDELIAKIEPQVAPKPITTLAP